MSNVATPDGEIRLTTSAEYVINGDSGKIHHRFRARPDRKELSDYPRCNLDQIKHRVAFKTREQVAHWFLDRRLKPKPCKRCFPEPTPDEIDSDNAVPIDETPVGADPEAERMPVEEMDPEDVPEYAEEES